MRWLKRLEAYFGGRVQGVGFRAATHYLARGFDVVGTVRNLPDGRVEVVAEGAPEELEAFLTGIGESDLAGYIKERTVNWREARGDLKGFKIIH
jgi:acylphosphatase